MNMLHRMVALSSLALTVAGALLIATLSGLAGPERRAGFEAPAGIERSDAVEDTGVQVAQAAFVRQDVIYSDPIVTASPSLDGVPCGVRCGQRVSGTVQRRTVKERYWYRTDVTGVEATPPSVICSGVDCPSR